MNPLLIAALINNIAIPEIGRWLAELHASGRVVTEAEALRKLDVDVDAGNEAGRQFLMAHGG